MPTCSLIREEHLIDDDVGGGNLVLSELLYKSFRLIEREELWDHHAHKGS